MYDSRLRLANQIYEEVKRPFRDLVFTTVIQRNVKLSEASSYGKPVLLYDADSKGSINHMQLAQEIVEKIKDYGSIKKIGVRPWIKRVNYDG